MLNKQKWVENNFSVHSSTVRPRFWQLVGAPEKCCQNRVLPKPDNDWEIAKNSKTNFMG
jgi:hypothetical protein